MTFEPGDRVVRNRETWTHLDLNDPRAGLGVGTVIRLYELGRIGREGFMNAALVKWGEVSRLDLMSHLRAATAIDEEGPDYDDPAILWPAFSAEWVASYGSDLRPILLDDVRRRYEARLEALRGDQ